MSAPDLSGAAMALLEEIRRAPHGLTLDVHSRDVETGRAAVEAAQRGLIKVRHRRYVLTRTGRELLGAADYTGHDPSAWPAEDRERFYLSGYCHVLALALHEHTGHQLVLLLDGAVKSRFGGPAVFHVFVETPDGQAIDFDGHTSRERMVRDCGAKKPLFRAVCRAGLMAKVGQFNDLAEFDADDLDCAKRAADEVLARLGPSAVPGRR